MELRVEPSESGSRIHMHKAQMQILDFNSILGIDYSVSEPFKRRQRTQGSCIIKLTPTLKVSLLSFHLYSNLSKWINTLFYTPAEICSSNSHSLEAIKKQKKKTHFLFFQPKTTRNTPVVKQSWHY